MVKLKGPGMAEHAAGSIGGVLTFSNTRGRSYAKKLTIPKQPRPQIQVASRETLRFLTSQWAGMNLLVRATWKHLPRHTDLDHYRQYLSENLRTFQLAQAPSRVYPPTRLGDVSTWNSWVTTVQNRRVIHTVDVNTVKDGWGCFFMRDRSAIVANHLDFTVNIIEMSSPTTFSWFDGPLPLGTWWYKARRFTITGKLAASHGSRSVTIT